MNLRSEFLIHQNDNETLLVPAGGAEFSGIVKGNNTFGEILSLLKDDTSEPQIIKSMCERYEAPEEVISQDVRKILDSLRSINALDE